jgi:hypothetical protein
MELNLEFLKPKSTHADSKKFKALNLLQHVSSSEALKNVTKVAFNNERIV